MMHFLILGGLTLAMTALAWTLISPFVGIMVLGMCLIVGITIMFLPCSHRVEAGRDAGWEEPGSRWVAIWTSLAFEGSVKMWSQASHM